MEKLKKLVEKETTKESKNAIDNLKKRDKNDILNLWYYKDKLTNTQYNKYINNELTDKQIKEILKKKIIKEYEKRKDKTLKRIETITQANENITILFYGMLRKTVWRAIISMSKSAKSRSAQGI